MHGESIIYGRIFVFRFNRWSYNLRLINRYRQLNRLSNMCAISFSNRLSHFLVDKQGARFDDLFYQRQRARGRDELKSSQQRPFKRALVLMTHHVTYSNKTERVDTLMISSCFDDESTIALIHRRAVGRVTTIFAG